ncbi:1,2-oxophytodienoate reductase [Streptomyces graminofaciens]|uniref:1,2-oxophytodienoate reductase n=1 Tax=Streptomyces graminofaciens TaxID=68212 RepID=A0ABN5VLE8_9ACTN|nr:NADH:flavin oxidoreductase [Streptomyces graminofaciens]BBC34272.1 1,2-oxophytodienoate reductase [Streptomyces graminofaciens]
MTTASTASATSRAAEILSRPVSINGLTVPNRIAMAPMTRAFSPGGVPGADVASYYGRRAAAGVGLIVTEGTYVGHETAGDHESVPRFHGEEQLAGWAKVVEAVHAGGGTIVPQLWHIGTERSQGKLFPEAPVLGPSGLRGDGSTPEGGRAMTSADLDEVVAAFARAAADAERIGMDGVELHGAHGYLIDQFLWARTNRRTDAYGGDLASRAKFAAEVVAAVRAAVSASFPVIFRFSQWKLGAYDARLADTPEELEALLTPLAAAGVDAFHASTRRYWEPEFDGSDLNLAGWTKKLTGRPTITVGSVGLEGDVTGAYQGQGSEVRGIDDLLDSLEAERFDLVAVGRALLQDPEWAAKVLDGRFGELTAFEAAAMGSLS